MGHLQVNFEAKGSRVCAVRLDEFLKNDDAIRKLAHYYWQLRGRPKGSPWVDWFKAEEEIEGALLADIELGLPV